MGTSSKKYYEIDKTQTHFFIFSYKMEEVTSIYTLILRTCDGEMFKGN